MLKNHLLPLFLIVVCIFGLLAGCAININIGNPSEDAANKTDGKTIFDYIFKNGSIMYESRANIYIATTTTDSAISSSDLIVTESLVATIDSILQSNMIQDKIREEFPGVEYTLSVESINETELCSIIATGESPEYLDEICNIAVSMLCEQISQIVEGSSCRVIDYAKQPVQ